MAFAAEEIEDGTGLSTALVYQDSATVASFLTRRGATKFDAIADEADQDAIVLKATAAAEDEISFFIRGQKRNYNQGLLWPGDGRLDIHGQVFADNAIPPDLTEAIALICEEMAPTSTWLTGASGSAMVGVKRFRADKGEYELTDGHDTTAMKSAHPQIYRRLRRVLPGDP